MQSGFSWGLIAGSLALAIASGSATTQTAAGSIDRRVFSVDEVVVTARRRTEALQDVPVSVAVLDSAALEEQGFHTEADLQVSIPGLVFLSA